MNLITDDAALINIVPALSTNSIVFTIPKSIPPLYILAFMGILKSATLNAISITYIFKVEMYDIIYSFVSFNYSAHYYRRFACFCYIIILLFYYFHNFTST